jgi:hypothetical protein
MLRKEFYHIILVNLWLMFWGVQSSSAHASSFELSDKRKAIEEYIETYSFYAIRNQIEFKIPASITLAQGILESDAGNSLLAREANNHFGIKCHKDWQGKTFIKDDDAKDECFRKYKHASESYDDHSRFLTQRSRYKELFELEMTDYKGWANGLKKAGYATDPKYPDKLIRIIEEYQLNKFVTEPERVKATSSDKKESGSKKKKEKKERKKKEKTPETKTPKEPVIAQKKREVLRINQRKVIRFEAGDKVADIAQEFTKREDWLLKYNDIKDTSEVQPGQYFYLQPKRNKSSKASIITQQETTLIQISNMEGVKLTNLEFWNKEWTGKSIPKGTSIYLRNPEVKR